MISDDLKHDAATFYASQKRHASFKKVVVVSKIIYITNEALKHFKTRINFLNLFSTKTILMRIPTFIFTQLLTEWAMSWSCWQHQALN